MDDLEAFLATTWTPPPMNDGPMDVVGNVRALAEKMRDAPSFTVPQVTDPAILALARSIAAWPRNE